MTKIGAGRTFWRHFLQPVIENRGGDGFLGAGLAKNKFCTDMLGLLSPKTTLNLFQVLMNVSCSHGFAPWGVVRLWWRSSSRGLKKLVHRCFSSLFSTNAALYCKNDLVSSKNALSTEGLIFIWFLANSVTKFHILGKKTLYRTKVLYNDTFHINFEHL